VFGGVGVVDYVVFEGVDCVYVVWGVIDYVFGFGVYCDEVVGVFVDGYDVWFVEDDILVVDVDECVGGVEVDGYVVVDEG